MKYGWTNYKLYSCKDCINYKLGNCKFKNKEVCSNGRYNSYYAAVSNVPKNRIGEKVKLANLRENLLTTYKYIEEAVNSGYLAVFRPYKRSYGMTTFGISLINQYISKLDIIIDNLPLYATYFDAFDYVVSYRKFIDGKLDDDVKNYSIQNIQETPFFILDGLGNTKYSPFEFDLLKALINFRKSGKLCTFIIEATPNTIHPEQRKLLLDGFNIFEIDSPLWSRE